MKSTRAGAKTYICELEIRNCKLHVGARFTLPKEDEDMILKNNRSVIFSAPS